MHSPELASFLSAAASCANSMLGNAAYIEKELPAIKLPDSHRRAIRELCSELIGTKHDVLSEIHELYELCELSRPPDPKEVRKRVDRIVNWLSEELPKLNAVVTSLDQGDATDFEIGRAFILVAESGANILRSHATVTQAARIFREAAARAGPDN